MGQGNAGVGALPHTLPPLHTLGLGTLGPLMLRLSFSLSLASLPCLPLQVPSRSRHDLATISPRSPRREVKALDALCSARAPVRSLPP